MEQYKILEIILAKMDDMKANQERINVSLAKMNADQTEAKREREADKEGRMAEMKVIQHEIKALREACRGATNFWL
jgi:hypothetical protein